VVPLNDWSAPPALISPFRLRWDSFKRLKVAKGLQYDRTKHLLEVAMDWEVQMSHNKGLSSSDIAIQVGLSSGRVRQILSFNRLHKDVQFSILEEVSNKGRAAVPERVLRALAREDSNKQKLLLARFLQD
jgi:DNA-binding transcriptional regulator LsrR (DeoR family)